MRTVIFRFLALGLLLFVGVGLIGCKARQAASGSGAGADSQTAAVDSGAEPYADPYMAPRDAVVAPEGGKLTGNKLVFGDASGDTARNVYGTYTEGNGEVSGNTLTIKGGVITDSAYGAYSNGWAKNNKVVITGGKITDRLEGGHGRQGSQGNEIVFAGGSAENAYGGYSADGPADNNRLVLRGGTVKDDAQAGLSLRSSASGNTLIMEGGVVEDQVYGGYGMEGPATGNTTIVSGGTIADDAQGAVSSTHAATGNTLILRGSPKIGGSLYGAFAVGEYGDKPDDITGNKILFEGFNGELGDIWNAETLNIDAESRIASRESVLNFYDCRNVNNDGVIAAAQGVEVYFDTVDYGGKGRFELAPDASILMSTGKLKAPLRIEIKAPGQLVPFSRALLVELRNIKLGAGLKPGTAVQLVSFTAGGLSLRLEHEEAGGSHYWYVSGQ